MDFNLDSRSADTYPRYEKEISDKIGAFPCIGEKERSKAGWGEDIGHIKLIKARILCAVSSTWGAAAGAFVVNTPDL